jgi:hypothetical protein
LLSGRFYLQSWHRWGLTRLTFSQLATFSPAPIGAFFGSRSVISGLQSTPRNSHLQNLGRYSGEFSGGTAAWTAVVCGVVVAAVSLFVLIRDFFESPVLRSRGEKRSGELESALRDGRASHIRGAPAATSRAFSSRRAYVIEQRQLWGMRRTRPQTKRLELVPPPKGSGRWTTGTSMPSARTEIAVAEVSGT